jgi:hypothetical protein
MKTFLIERNIPGAGELTATDLKNISIASCNVLEEMGPSIEWIQSYVSCRQAALCLPCRK